MSINPTGDITPQIPENIQIAIDAYEAVNVKMSASILNAYFYACSLSNPENLSSNLTSQPAPAPLKLIFELRDNGDEGYSSCGFFLELNDAIEALKTDRLEELSESDHDDYLNFDIILIAIDGLKTQSKVVFSKSFEATYLEDLDNCDFIWKEVML